jgi:glycerol-3-phosphate dehydrogenase (NAD(P)+)
MDRSKKIVGVIGGGSWATAIIKILTENVTKVHWWMRNEDAVENILKYRRNLKYLQAVELKIDKINVTTNLEEVVKASDIIILATPSAFLSSLFNDFPVELFRGKTVFSAIKGIIPEYHAIPARFIHKTFDIPYERI